MKVKSESESEVAQSCLTLSDPMDCSPPGSSIHGIFQARAKTFPAVVKDVENGLIFFDIQEETDFDLSGWWTLWPEVRFDDDRTACGRAVRFFVYESGSV